MPLDAHLHDIRSFLRKEKDIIEKCDPPLINFEKWSQLKKMVMDLLRYRDSFLEKISTYKQQGGIHVTPGGNSQYLERVVAYLDSMLRSDTMDGDGSLLIQTNVAAKPKGSKQITRREDAERRVGFGGRRGSKAR
jgi:hypothetical protein